MQYRVPPAIIETCVRPSGNDVFPCNRTALWDVAVPRLTPEAEHIAAQIVAEHVPDVQANAEPWKSSFYNFLKGFE